MQNFKLHIFFIIDFGPVVKLAPQLLDQWKENALVQGTVILEWKKMSEFGEIEIFRLQMCIFVRF